MQKKKHLRNLVWVCQQNKVDEVEQVEEVNIVTITNEANTQNFEIPYQEASNHHEIVRKDHDICDEVQTQADSPKSSNSDQNHIEYDPF